VAVGVLLLLVVVVYAGTYLAQRWGS